VELSGLASEDGKALAAQYCGSCHVLPDPSILDQTTWVTKVFPRMRKLIGLDQVPDAELAQHDLRSFYPTHPTMTEDEWFTVASYYIDNAPKALSPAPRQPLVMDTVRWKAEEATITVPTPLTTLCRFDSVRSMLLTSDGMQARFTISAVDGTQIVSVPLVGPASWAVPTSTGWLVTDMGKLLPHDSAVGALWQVSWNEQGRTASARKLLDTLRRPTHVSVGDVDGDKRDDYVVCEYGNMYGRFGYYSILANGRVGYTNLNPLPGAIRSMIRDINGDGKLDIVVLMAQAREGIYAYINRGKGKFEMTTLLAFHPAFGSSSFDLVDTDADGDLDLVVTSGDNGDYEFPPLKPYHGVYIFANDGNLVFTQQTFLPQNGAYGAMVRDFDRDGDLDILSIAYFADFSKDASEAIIYWQRDDDGSYHPFTVQGADKGRWMVYDVADVDADGDLDVVLGNVSMGPGTTSASLRDRWMNEGRSYMLLRNTSR
jgi:hypothetical protein